MKYYLLFGLLIIYFIWTLRFAIKFNATDIYFNKRQRMIHNVLIWIVPFIWIMIIKMMTEPIPGSHHYNKTKDKGSFSESGIGILGDSSENGSTHH